MKVFLGPFHPHLEDALVGEVADLKARDPLRPLLVLVPSESLRRRLQVLLASERGGSFLNLHLLTFYQLSRRLFEERLGPPGPELSDDAFLEEALRHLIRAQRGAFSPVAESAGGCAALWQTLRDLKDGLVDPGRAAEALQEGFLGRDPAGRLSALLALYAALKEQCRARDILDYTDLDARAVSWAAGSAFLGQFVRVFHYGFYDLTQVQVDLMHAVARRCPTTLLFPLLKEHPGWDFARRFYERHVAGLVTAASQVRDLGAERPPGTLSQELFREAAPGPADRFAESRRGAGPPACELIGCSGPRDEVLTAAKEILRLAEEEGLAFGEIGVVARGLEPYGPWVQSVFGAHRIPFSASGREPLLKFPLAKAVLLLAGLAARDFPRARVMDLLSSPYFRARRISRQAVEPRPELWDVLTRRLGIVRGREDWERLRPYLKKGLPGAGLEEAEDPRYPAVPPEQVRFLHEIVQSLQTDLIEIPKEDSYSKYSERWLAILEKYLGGAEDRREAAFGREGEVWEKIIGVLEKLARLDALARRTSLTGFLETFCRWLEREGLPWGDGEGAGVFVLDAMSARGLSFRALFVLGMNEGVFPRTIREDAFLRDPVRRALETVLGYKVPEKLAGYDEEKLLFGLLCGSARERLYCLYQRSDEGGRPLAPSWYLTEFRRAAGACVERDIPRGVLGKRESPPFDRPDFLLPAELAVRLSLLSRPPSEVRNAFSLWPGLYERGFRAAALLDASSERLTERDGMVGPLPDYWEAVVRRGAAPTALESYARCPFQFFSAHVLGLEPLERPEEETGPDGLELGRLCHEILEGYYGALAARGFFESGGGAFPPGGLLEEVAGEVFGRHQRENPVGYPVAWEVLQEQLLAVLEEAVRADLEELAATGFVPAAFEEKVRGTLPADWPPPLAGLAIQGRMDRIDRHPAAGRYRVIDYKYKGGKNRRPEDRDLVKAAVQGKRLQPPFYLLLAGEYARRKNGGEGCSVSSAFYFIAPRWGEGRFAVSEYPEEGLKGRTGEQLKGALAFLLEGVKNGRFFHVAGDHCKHCDFSGICRKNHRPTAWRADRDPAVRPHRALAKQRLEGAEKDG